ncbi:hypothetical protein I4U23_024111 [Adineta vaga]|nr:hypothetical protein I4U23_024111 [Adineta vaga]
MKTAIDEIKKICKSRVDELSNEKKQKLKTIEIWGRDLKDKIHRHMDEEAKRLEQEFTSQKTSLETVGTEFIQRIKNVEEKQPREHFDGLIAEYKKIQFKLNDLDIIKRKIDSITVILTNKQRMEEDPNVNKSPRNTSAKNEQRTAIIDNNHVNGNSVSTIDKPSGRRSSTTQTSPESDRSTRIDNNTKSNSNYDNDMLDRCPICYMIFPTNMNRNDRDQHANEHYADD